MTVSTGIQQLKEGVFAQVAHRFSQVILVVLGGVSVAIGGFSAYHSHFSHPQYSYLPPDDVWQDFLAAFPRGTTEGGSVVVEVAGAVEKPGVYTLSSGARWQEALLQAGGFSEKASQRFVHQEINLSKILLDQEKIYIPFQVEESVMAKSTGTEGSGSGFKSINQLTKKELEAIPGIGATRAEKFLSGIPYASIEDLVERSGLPEAVRTELLKLYSL